LVNKGFIIWDKARKHDKFFLRDKARIPSAQSRLGSQSQRRIRFILPARGASHIIRQIIKRKRNDNNQIEKLTDGRLVEALNFTSFD